MTHADYFMMALCLWREARGEGRDGQIAVGSVIRNRSIKRMSSVYSEVVKPWQFSSITASGDAQLAKYPVLLDTGWKQCQEIAQAICDGEIADATGGATLYWNPNGIESDATFKLNDGSVVKFPKTWSVHAVKETVVIGNHVFLQEI